MRDLPPYLAQPDAPIHMAAAGCCTPVGYSVEAAVTAVRAGVTAFGAHPFFVDKGGKPLIAASVEALAPECRLPGRLAALGRGGLIEAIEPLRTASREWPRVPLFLGTREPGLLDEHDKAALCHDLRRHAAERGVDIEVHLIERGGASGSMAIQAACTLIDAGRADVAVAGGVDSFLDWEILEPLEEAERIHSSLATWGFCPGEASAFCLLASDRAVRAEGWRTCARILAAATEVEVHRIGTPTVCLGQGLTAAMRQTLAPLERSAVRVSRVIADMNGEPYRGDEFGFSLVRLSHYFADGIEADTPADCWGNAGAATGPLGIILAAHPGSETDDSGSLAMSLATSDNGYRTSVLLAVP